MAARPTTVGAYLKGVDAARRDDFAELRKLVRRVLPKAKETMSYRMPTYELGAPVCAIAAQKQYLALYVCETDALDDFRGDFAHLNVGKGCIRFKRLEDLPRKPATAVLREAAKRIRAS